jgi:hypothetical protein
MEDKNQQHILQMIAEHFPQLDKLILEKMLKFIFIFYLIQIITWQ